MEEGRQSLRLGAKELGATLLELRLLLPLFIQRCAGGDGVEYCPLVVRARHEWQWVAGGGRRWAAGRGPTVGRQWADSVATGGPPAIYFGFPIEIPQA